MKMDKSFWMIEINFLLIIMIIMIIMIFYQRLESLFKSNQLRMKETQHLTINQALQARIKKLEFQDKLK